MLFWIYNWLLILISPVFYLYFLIRALFLKKRAPISYFFPVIPKKYLTEQSIWIHAVSLGEVRTARPLISELRQSFHSCEIFVSTSTETGYEAASSIEGVKAFYLPIDMVFLQNHVISKIDPKIFITIEGDVWPSLGYCLNKKHIPQVLVSAKISERSLRRIQKFAPLQHMLYGNFHLILTQDEMMKDRFLRLEISHNKVHVGGNLKLIPYKNETIARDKIERLHHFLKTDPDKKTCVISCTHQNEELLILNSLKGLASQLNFIVIPRHPQRFEDVFTSIKNEGWPISKLSGLQSCCGDIFLIDAMGITTEVYKLSDVVILGGSFVAEVGGHNVMEPIYYSCPVIVGPHMETQMGPLKEMLNEELGIQSELSDLAHNVLKIIYDTRYLERVKSYYLKTSKVAHKIVNFLKDAIKDEARYKI